MKGIWGIPLHAILILLLLIFVLPSCGHRELPSISVCARIAEDRGDTITIQWYVKNTSDFPIAFAENHLAVWQTNLTEEHVVPTEACTLDPGEKLVLEFEVSGLDRTISEHFSVTAECREGTSATTRFQIPRLEEESSFHGTGFGDIHHKPKRGSLSHSRGCRRFFCRQNHLCFISPRS